jgi:DegV family protein with EDD domain
MQVKIIADSTCDLPQEIIHSLNIDIIPLYVILDEVSYRDLVDITPQELIDWSNKTGMLPKTSAPSVEDFLNVFKPYEEKKQDIIFVGISTGLSSTCQNALIASGMIDSINIGVIDSLSVSSGTGCAVLKAALLANAGKSQADIMEEMKAFVPRINASFIIDTIKFLKLGGRCTAMQAIGVNALKLKPEIVSREGKLITGDIFRGSIEKVSQRYLNKRFANVNEIDPEFIIIGRTMDGEELDEIIYQYIKNLNYFKNIYRVDAGCVITTHCGPNTHGLMYVNKY